MRQVMNCAAPRPARAWFSMEIERLYMHPHRPEWAFYWVGWRLIPGAKQTEQTLHPLRASSCGIVRMQIFIRWWLLSRAVSFPSALRLFMGFLGCIRVWQCYALAQLPDRLCSQYYSAGPDRNVRERNRLVVSGWRQAQKSSLEEVAGVCSLAPSGVGGGHIGNFGWQRDREGWFPMATLWTFY